MSPRSILVVEDELELMEAIKKGLEQNGFKVLLADSLAVCKTMLLKYIPDLLLLDVMLPDGDGVDFAHKLADDPRYVSMGIILISGMKINKADIEKGLSYGALHYIKKPFNINELIDKIELIIRVRELENRNRQIQIQYSYLFSKTNDIFFILDSDLMILNLSNSFEKITGLKVSDKINKNFDVLISEKYKEEWLLNVQLLNKSGTLPRFETYFVNSLKNNIPVEIHITSTVYTNKADKAYLGIVKDLREIREIEVLKKQMTNLAESSTKKEIESLETIASGSMNITEQNYQSSVLSDPKSEVFINLMESYRKLVEKMVEQSIYKNKFIDNDAYRLFANELGFLKAGPRDLIRIHTHYLNSNIDAIHPKRMELYNNESRLALLNIMGYLVSFYKNKNYYNHE